MRMLPVIVARTPTKPAKRSTVCWEWTSISLKVLSGLSRDAYFALAEQARHWDMRMVGHIPASVTGGKLVAARQSGPEHLFGVMNR